MYQMHENHTVNFNKYMYMYAKLTLSEETTVKNT